MEGSQLADGPETRDPCNAGKKPPAVVLVHGLKAARRPPRMVMRVRTAQGIILLLHHCAQCTTSPCGHWEKCWLGKLMLKHVKNCSNTSCKSPICAQCKMAMAHFKYCVNEKCPVCQPVKHLLKSSDCLKSKAASSSQAQESGHQGD